MPLRFRILPAPRTVRATPLVGADWGDADRGPSDERAFEASSELEELRIGRQRGLEIELPFSAVSSNHARLLRGHVPSDWRVEDLRSMNGTWLDGRRLSPGQPVPLLPGQRLRIAMVDIIFEGWAATPGGGEGTATIARRLISDLFGAAGGDIARLVVESGSARQGDLRLEVVGRRYLAGRADSCDLVLVSEHVSREHAAFVRRWDGVVVTDIGSKNGVLVNGQAIPGEQHLADGDTITVGTTIIRLTDPEDRYRRRLESFGAGAIGGPATGDQVPPGSPVPSPLPGARMVTPALVISPTRAADSEPPSPSLSVEERAPSGKPFGRLITALIGIVAVVAGAGLLALWLTTR